MIRRQHSSALLVEVAALTKLSIEELRRAWTDHFREDAPAVRSRDVIARMFAWRLQAAAFGGLDARTQRQLHQIANALERDGSYEPQIRRDVSPGVDLTREWKGVTHKVTVTPEGFR